jgi:hypothetical protein
LFLKVFKTKTYRQGGLIILEVRKKPNKPGKKIVEKTEL